ncbi:hypothetical protein GCM10009527_047750 [Actinomadura nitritigenes]
MANPYRSKLASAAEGAAGATSPGAGKLADRAHGSSRALRALAGEENKHPQVYFGRFIADGAGAGAQEPVEVGVNEATGAVVYRANRVRRTQLSQ